MVRHAAGGPLIATDPSSTGSRALPALVADGTLDAELAALLWLLVEDGVPLVVAGDAGIEARAAIAAAILDAAPARPWAILDADAEVGGPDAEALGAMLRGGVTPAVVVRAASFREAVTRLTQPPHGLPEDAVRRLGAVLVVDGGGESLAPRVVAAHYLRPTERDAQGHLQRRPPAVLATLDPATGEVDHFAWAITPELADRVDRSQADLEGRMASRSVVLGRAATAGICDARGFARVLEVTLAAEPPREQAPEHPPARRA